MTGDRCRSTANDTDIWAFGCVGYEMVTGRRVFDGEDIAEMLGR